MTLNFNALAWEAPLHGDEYGYLPADEFYAEIIEWLKTGTTIWKSKTGNKSSKRISFEGYTHDVIATYNHTTKMINWVFKAKGTYQI